MEIKLTNKQKVLLEGLVRTSIFLIAIRELSLFVCDYITGPIIGFLTNCITFIPEFSIPFLSQEFYDFITLPVIFLMYLIFIIFNNYVIAKICGIHKYFSQFKFWKSFLLLLLISYFAYYFIILNLHTFKLNYSAQGDADIAYSIIPSYLVYLFFNFLTKKFPMPFEKIGYFFSLEFYKNLGLKLWKKLRKIG